MFNIRIWGFYTLRSMVDLFLVLFDVRIVGNADILAPSRCGRFVGAFEEGCEGGRGILRERLSNR